MGELVVKRTKPVPSKRYRFYFMIVCMSESGEGNGGRQIMLYKMNLSVCFGSQRLKEIVELSLLKELTFFEF
jgi:hypothetical protein